MLADVVGLTGDKSPYWSAERAVEATRISVRFGHRRTAPIPGRRGRASLRNLPLSRTRRFCTAPLTNFCSTSGHRLPVTLVLDRAGWRAPTAITVRGIWRCWPACPGFSRLSARQLGVPRSRPRLPCVSPRAPNDHTARHTIGGLDIAPHRIGDRRALGRVGRHGRQYMGAAQCLSEGRRGDSR